MNIYLNFTSIISIRRTYYIILIGTPANLGDTNVWTEPKFPWTKNCLFFLARSSCIPRNLMRKTSNHHEFPLIKQSLVKNIGDYHEI